ncbi:MAG TPA: acyl-CoA dehydrogenase family protein [Streptosporangiaceae bacterium]|nr:acyl-CoA dehydrogenase family protein [Streptosporangiaceae bacterium]
MGLTDEQRSLRESVRDLLRRHRPAPVDGAGADDGADGEQAALWRLLGDVGVAGLAVPERFGGAGAGPVEVAVVAEELGRVLAPAPFLGSAVLTTQAILRSSDTGACERLLPALAGGSAIGALAWTGQEGGWDPCSAACLAAEQAGGGWTMTGEAHYVLDGDLAHVLIAAAALPDGGVGLFGVDPGQPGTDRRRAPSMDQTRRLGVVRLAGAAGQPLASAAPAAPADQGAALAGARDMACLALAAEQAGAAAAALEQTVAYTGTRVQFGRPIASFQAISHRLAELHVRVESARALAYHAARMAGLDDAGTDPQAGLLAAAAKAYCSEALAAVAAEMIQLHGAIGATWEHDAHRYLKRAHGSAQLLGAPPAHLARIAATVIDG